MRVHRKFFSLIVCIILFSAWPAFADYYAVTDMTWAEFYAGEVGESETNLLSEGLDAVTTATVRFVTRFNQAVSSTSESGSTFTGLKAVQVKMSDEVYEIFKNDSRFTFTDTKFDEYKILNSDGSFGKMISETLPVNTASVKLSSGASSNHGDYMLNISGLDFEALGLDIGASFDNYLGVELETKEGNKYGLRPLYNIWVRTTQLGFSVKDFTERNGTIIDSKYTNDLAGQTITKITFLLKNQPDPFITCDVYVKESSTAAAAPVYESGFNAYELNSDQIQAKFIINNSPSGANYNKIASISYDDPNGHHGWSTLPASYYNYSDGVLTMKGDIISAAHSYRVILEDSNGRYSDISASFESFSK